jgi:hypothetical protein
MTIDGMGMGYIISEASTHMACCIADEMILEMVLLLE